MLEQFLISQLFAFLLIFCRIGSGIMVLPGFGEAYVSTRIRLLLALCMTLVLTPLLQASLPALPASPLGLFMLMLAEIMVGLFIGFISRILISTLHIAGQIISFQSSLATANFFDFNQGTQGTLMGNFLSVTAVVLMFILDLHHLMLRGLVDSYSLFPAGAFPPVQDFSNLAAQMLSKAFMVAIQLSAPFIVVGLLLYLGAGVLSRLMPTMQVFFIMMPLQLTISFFLLLATLSAMMLGYYIPFLQETLTGFLTP